jgi:rubrerythrin
MADSRASAQLALEVGIQTEKDGRAFYLNASQNTHDPDGRALFARLADDELKHLALLEGQLASLRQTGGWLPKIAPAPGKASRTVFDRKLSSAELNDLTSDLSALRVAFLIEQDAIAFYTRAGQRTDDPSGKKMFASLVAMEQSHYDLLSGEYNLLSEQYKYVMGFEPF